MGVSGHLGGVAAVAIDVPKNYAAMENSRANIQRDRWPFLGSLEKEPSDQICNEIDEELRNQHACATYPINRMLLPDITKSILSRSKRFGGPDPGRLLRSPLLRSLLLRS